MGHVNFSVFSGEISEEPLFQTTSGGSLLLKFKVKTTQEGMNDKPIYEWTNFEAWGKNAQRLWDTGLIRFNASVLVWGARKKTTSAGEGADRKYYTNYSLDFGASVLPLGALETLNVRPIDTQTGHPADEEEAPRPIPRLVPSKATRAQPAPKTRTAPVKIEEEDEDLPF